MGRKKDGRARPDIHGTSTLSPARLGGALAKLIWHVCMLDLPDNRRVMGASTGGYKAVAGAARA